MESWKQGRADLLDELTKICNRIESDISSEVNDASISRVIDSELTQLRRDASNVGKLEEDNARLKDELEKSMAVARRVDGLERENKRLAVELEKALQQQKSDGTSTPRSSEQRMQTPIPGTNDDARTVPWEQHRRLIEKHNQIFETLRITKEVKDTLDGRLRKVKRDLTKWQEDYHPRNLQLIKKKDAKIARMAEELKMLREKLGIADVDSSVVADGRDTPVGKGHQEVPPFERPAGMEDVGSPGSGSIRDGRPSHPGGRSQEDMDELLLENAALPNPHPSFEDEAPVGNEADWHHTSSTQGSSPLAARKPDKTSDVVEVKNEPGSSPIILISSTRISKRKGRHDSEEHTPIPRVKKEDIELITSSPLGLAGFSYLNDSIDLDDIGEKQDTPRKQRQIQILPRQSVSAAQYSSHHPEQEPNQTLNGPTHTPAARAFYDTSSRSVLQPRSINTKVLPRTSAEGPQKKRRIVKSNDIAALIEDGELDSERQLRETSELSDRILGLLEKPSPPRASNSPTTAQIARRKRNTSGLAREVRVSSEEPELSPPRPSHFINSDISRLSTRGTAARSDYTSRPISKGSSRSSVEPPRPSSKGPRGSLDSPFSKAALNKARLSTHLESEYFSRPSPRARLEPVPKTSLLPLLETPKRSPERRPKPRANEMDIDPDEEPLRCRPVERLDIYDFKINPNYNQGYKYAFNEVVRGKEARKCLQGCTKPNCCGKQFRALAEMTRSNRRNPMIYDEEDFKVMQAYLGDNAHKLWNMSKEEKWDILMQATMRDMSNKYGNHRHAYERKASPPGFWRTDFPTTQEHEADRQKAKEKEREAVMERYMEAMRPGGAYIFRDE